MKFYIVFVVIVSLGLANGRLEPLPVTQVPKDSKPNHGGCFRNSGITCPTAGARVQYDGEDCVDCICDTDLKGVTCCMLEPYPLVKHPKYCDTELNTTTCTYTFQHRKCRNACVITGYEFSDVDFTPDKDHPKV